MWGQGAGAPGKGVRNPRLGTARGSAAIGRLGLSQVSRAGAGRLAGAEQGWGRAAGARAGRVRVAVPGALLGVRGRSATITAPALRTLLPETVRDEETESALGLQ